MHLLRWGPSDVCFVVLRVWFVFGARFAWIINLCPPTEISFSGDGQPFSSNYNRSIRTALRLMNGLGGENTLGGKKILA